VVGPPGDAHRNANHHTHADRYGYAFADRLADSHADRYGYAFADRHPHGHADCDADAHAHSHGDEHPGVECVWRDACAAREAETIRGHPPARPETPIPLKSCPSLASS